MRVLSASELFNALQSIKMQKVPTDLSYLRLASPLAGESMLRAREGRGERLGLDFLPLR